MKTHKQGWWAPLGWVLVLAQVGVALAFILGEGTSNILMTPLAIAVIVGLVITQVRSATPIETP
ncbi:MAG TPA: hypothetical protein VNA87_06615 [Actinomycetota bacterium]|nr:hypothetical protein [Actinomycetota bacterium]